MQPVLIQTDPDKIIEHKAYLNQAVTYLQQLYDKFQAIGITVSIEDMRQIVQPNNRYTGYFTDFVAEKLLEKAGTPDFGGVPIKREKLRDMLDIPDTKEIQAFVEVSNPLSLYPYHHIDPNLLQITNGIVSKTANSDATVEAKHTFYTNNDRGVEVVTKIKTVIQQLQGYKDYLADHVQPSFWKELELEKMGIENISGNLRPSLNFVRDQERVYPNYVAA